MDKSMAQALMGLIPTHTGPLPPELLELAVSLLAQSRSKASSLKADEEIARSYACANLACERLKQSLNLPKIEPRPPCPPKVYQKLYRYLDGALPTGARRTARLSRPNPSASAPQSSLAKPGTLAKTTPLRPDTRQKRIPQKPSISSTEAPAWVMPVIRRLCDQMGALAAPHHIFAGVSSILAVQEQQSAVKTQALIVAIYILVITRLTGTETAPSEYRDRRDLALETVKNASKKDEAHVEVGNTDIDHCMREIKNQKWAQMDWFRNITPGAGVGLDSRAEDSVEDASDSDKTDKALLLPVTARARGSRDSLEHEYLQAGLGTMMRDQVDYLSDHRRREYQEWKKGILAQIEELERVQEMDVRPG